jgi:predicted metal-dependent peptidase
VEDSIIEVAISSDEWNEICSQLEIHHALFYQLWQMSRPVMDESISTAAVRFDDVGNQVEFAFNPNFWKNLSVYERQFVICHEALHVIFNHGLRAVDAKDSRHCNIAMDVIVNHTLVNNFDFEREKLSIDQDLCWVDTVFKNKENVPADESFEFYYLLLDRKGSAERGDSEGPSNSIDNHDGLPGLGGEEWDKVVEKLNESLSEEEKSSIKDMLEQHTQETSKSRGTTSLGAWRFASTEKVKTKKKWETVIKKWSRKYMKRDEASVEQWARKARRYVLLPDDLILPSEMPEDHWSQDRIQVWFFQDCSGSCYNLKDRFFKAAKSLPKERFDVKMHTFDTQVFEIDMGKPQTKLWGWGGTSFTCLENYIQKYIKVNEVDYPKAVFVITDGYGNHVNPQKPENWYWFLSTSYRYCIPQTSSIFQLKDFE